MQRATEHHLESETVLYWLDRLAEHASTLLCQTERWEAVENFPDLLVAVSRHLGLLAQAIAEISAHLPEEFRGGACAPDDSDALASEVIDRLHRIRSTVRLVGTRLASRCTTLQGSKANRMLLN